MKNVLKVKCIMSWKVKRIQEDDFGCEERQDDAKVKVLVTLAGENGQERLIRVEDDWLYAHGIDEGSSWPEEVKFLKPKRKCKK